MTEEQKRKIEELTSMQIDNLFNQNQDSKAISRLADLAKQAVILESLMQQIQETLRKMIRERMEGSADV